MNTQRIILKPNVSRDDFDDLCWEAKWDFDTEIAGEEEQPYVLAWLTEDQETGIRFIADHRIDISYIEIVGENINDIANLITKSLDTISFQEIKDLLYNGLDVNNFIDAVYMIGVVAPQIDADEIIQLYTYASNHSIAKVRHATLYSLDYAINYVPDSQEQITQVKKDLLKIVINLSETDTGLTKEDAMILLDYTKSNHPELLN